VKIKALIVLIVTHLTLWAGPKSKEGQHLAFTTILSAAPGELLFRSVDGIQAGFARLTSEVAIAGEPVHMELLASLEYHDGTGPFTGYITLSWLDGRLLGMRYLGGAVRHADGSTSVEGTLTILGGDGAYTGAIGRGVSYPNQTAATTVGV